MQDGEVNEQAGGQSLPPARVRGVGREAVSVLIVDDSPTARAALRHALIQDRDVRVVGEAEDGDQALRLVKRHKPSLVTMDVYLRRQNGLDVAGSIMAEAPCPILVVTAADPADPRLIYRAMEAGVLDVVAKPPAPSSPEYARARQALIRLVKRLACVPVVRRRARGAEAVAPRPATPVGPPAVSDAPLPRGIEMVVVGASTGGPPVVEAILRALPVPFPLPVVVVQHMAPGFLAGFAEWLSQVTRHKVAVVSKPMAVSSGAVYVAPDDAHIRLEDSRLLVPSFEAPYRHHRPSIDVLFQSVAAVAGERVIAVLLTGMGGDGADGMKALHAAGALTIAQLPSTCAVDSMPQRAIASGGTSVTLAPDDIGPFIATRAEARR